MGTIRTVLAVDGESKFKNSMKEINSTLKAMQANVKALSTEYTTNNTKVKNLQEQKKQLSEIEKQTEEKIKLLTAAVSRSGTAYQEAKSKMLDMVWLHGKESEEAEKARKVLASATVTYNNYRTQLANAETSLNQTRSALRDTDKAIDDNSKHTKSLGEQFKSLASVMGQVGSVTNKVAKTELAALQLSVKAVSAEFELGIKGLGAYAKAIGNATTAIGKFSIDKGTTFEASMSKLQAISQEAPENMERLEAAAKAAGASTTKTAAESADALTYMALAGWDTEQMLKGLNPIIKASEAGAMDLATASDLITDSMAAYGKSTDDLSQYLDVLTSAQSNSNASLQQMLEAYVEVGGTFKNLNVPIEESAAILGVLADRGIKGSTAGNKLSSTLINLIGANKNAASAMNTLGVSAWDDNGEFIGLSETIKKLGDALSTVSDEDMMKFEAKIGGKMQIDTLQALIAGTSDEFDELIEKFNKADGALEDTAATMLDNFKGAVELTKSAVEILGVSIFQTFSDELKNNVQQIAGWASDITFIIEKGPGYSVANLIKGKLGTEVQKSLKENIKNMSKMLPTITETFNTITLTALDVIINTADDATSTILPQIIDGFADLANGLVDRLPDFANQFSNAGNTLFSNLIPNMREFADNIVNQLPMVIDSITEYIDGQGIARTYLAGFDILMSLANGISDNLPVIVEQGMKLIMSMINGIVNRLPDILNTGMEIIYTLVNGIVNNIPKIITAAVDIIMIIVDTLIDNLPEIVRVALQIIIALIEGITKNIGKITERVPEIIMAIVDAILDNLDMILEAAIQIMFALAEGMIDAIPMIYDTFITIPEKIGEKLTSGDYWERLGQRCLEGIADGLTNVGSYVHQRVLEAANNLVSEFQRVFDIHSPSKLMEEKIGKFIGLGVADGTADSLTDSSHTLDKAAVDYSNEVMNSVQRAFDIHSPFKLEEKIGKFIGFGVDGTADALTDSLLTLDKAAVDYSNEVMNSVQRAFSANVSVNPVTTSPQTTVEQNITFGTVYINNDMDIDTLAYQLAERSRSYAIGGGY